MERHFETWRRSHLAKAAAGFRGTLVGAGSDVLLQSSSSENKMRGFAREGRFLLQKDARGNETCHGTPESVAHERDAASWNEMALLDSQRRFLRRHATFWRREAPSRFKRHSLLRNDALRFRTARRRARRQTPSVRGAGSRLTARSTKQDPAPAARARLPSARSRPRAATTARRRPRRRTRPAAPVDSTRRGRASPSTAGRCVDRPPGRHTSHARAERVPRSAAPPGPRLEPGPRASRAG
jgi:hypothetical protein